MISPIFTDLLDMSKKSGINPISFIIVNINITNSTFLKFFVIDKFNISNSDLLYKVRYKRYKETNVSIKDESIIPSIKNTSTIEIIILRIVAIANTFKNLSTVGVKL